MTFVRIDQTEMESADRELRAVATIVAESATGLRGAAHNSLPPAISALIDGGLASVERALDEIRTELLLEGVILTLRGMLAVTGSARGAFEPVAVAAPTSGLVGGWASSGLGSYGTAVESLPYTTGSSGLGSYGTAVESLPYTTGSNGLVPYGKAIEDLPYNSGGGGFRAWTEGTSPGRTAGLSSLRLGGMSGTTSPFLTPQANDFATWAADPNRNTDGDGLPNKWDPNPGTYDPETVDKSPLTKPRNF